MGGAVISLATLCILWTFSFGYFFGDIHCLDQDQGSTVVLKKCYIGGLVYSRVVLTDFSDIFQSIDEYQIPPFDETRNSNASFLKR